MTTAERLERAKTDIDEVYEAGKEAAMEAFAYAYQHVLSTGQPYTAWYQRFVQGGWKDDTFAYIKYPIHCKNDSNAATSVFTRCSMTHIDVPITIEGCAAQETFYYAQSLETIADITFIDVPSFLRMFTGCSKLKHIGIKGSIDVNFAITSAAELDEETVQAIIDALADLTDKTPQKVTFHTDVLLKLTPDQVKAIEDKNWTLE